MEQITKICSLCKIEKVIAEFYNPNNSHCKECRKKATKEYYKSNSKARKEYAKNYNIKNKEKVILRQKLYANKNRDKILKYNKNSYYDIINNEDTRLVYQKKQHERYLKRIQNPEYVILKNQKNKEYKLKNKEIIKKKRNIYQKNKYDTDPIYRTMVLLKTRFYKAIKRNNSKKIAPVLKLVGCTQEYLKSYLENQFRPEMNWENHGKIWEIDHILPITSFDLSNKDEQERCFHYSNLQPLFKTTKIALSFGYNEIGNKDKKDSLF